MFKDQPVRRKLMAVILLTGSAVLLLACGTFFLYELLTFRQTMVRNVSVVAQVVATNSTAALAFDNRTDATEVLSALSAERHIVAAALYDNTGALFARYPASAHDSRLPAGLERDGHQFAAAHMVLQEPVINANRRLGTLVLKSDLGAMYQRFSLYGALTALAIILSSLAAIPLSNRLQRHISRPVLALAESARTVSERKDYSVRATKFGDDELGRLADAFNDMLAQIQEQDAALRHREDELRREIAERQLAEETVRENQERLGLALEAAQVGHWELDLVTGAARRSPRHDQIFGYSDLLPEWSYEMFLKHVHPDDRASVADSFQTGIAAGDWNFDCRIIRADQAPRWIWARGHVFKNSLQQDVRMLGLVADITERKEAEEEIRRLNTDLERRVQERTAALLESEMRYRSLFDAIDEGYCIIEMLFDENEKPVDYRFLEINPSFDRQTGLGNAVGKRIRELAPQHEEHWFETYGRIAKDGEAVRFQNYAGQLGRWYDVYACRFGDPKNRQVAVVFSDITARKETEASIVQLNTELKERAAELEHANKELESFSYTVSHDLRAPLRHVHGYSEMLQKATEGQLSERAQRYLNTIAEATVEMGQLIDDLLEFSRVGRREMSEDHVRLDELVQETIRGLELTTMSRNIVWKTAPLPAVVGDRSLLKQVLANLVGNAVKYSRERDPARIEIGCGGCEDGRVILFVRDNGAGFDMQYAHKLFNVFQRLHRAEEFEGTGIGLASVRRIVARHGGRVWTEATVNKGATFYFTLKPSPSA